MKAQTQQRLRQLHRYVGIFFAPAILFFSVTGAVQTFRLSEGAGAPAWLVWMVAIHKDQAPPHARRPKPAAAPVPAAAPAHEPGDHDADKPGRRPSPLPLKIFVLFLATGLIVSTLLGTTIALVSRATRRNSVLLLVAGTVVPLLLLLV